MVLTARQLADDSGVDVLTQVHNQALRASIKEAAATPSQVLTGRVAAYVVGVKDVKTLQCWARGEVSALRPESESKVRTAYEIVTLLLRFEAAETIRAWFIGLAAERDDVLPARTIHEGRLQEAISAARAFAAHE